MIWIVHHTRQSQINTKQAAVSTDLIYYRYTKELESQSNSHLQRTEAFLVFNNWHNKNLCPSHFLFLVDFQIHPLCNFFPHEETGFKANPNQYGLDYDTCIINIWNCPYYMQMVWKILITMIDSFPCLIITSAFIPATCLADFLLF